MDDPALSGGFLDILSSFFLALFNGLSAVIVPGTNFSFMALIIAVLVGIFIIKVFKLIFGGSNGND